jgi:CheY-like chemotaxis protein
VETILLVEDSKFLRIATERVLSKAGYTVVSAADGEEALSMAITRLPNLILLDMLLPKLSGPDVLRSLKRDSRTAHIPVVVLSGLPQTNERKLVKDGAAGFLEKGALLEDPSRLLASIRSTLTGTIASGATAASNQ